MRFGGAPRRVHPNLVAWCAVLGVAACAVPYVAPVDVEAVNRCDARNDCAEGALCQGNICQAATADLTRLLVEVRPLDPLGQSYLFPPRNRAADLYLPDLVSLDGQIHVDTASLGINPGCLIFARITFLRLAPVQGLAFDPITVTSTYATPAGVADPESAFHVDLVPATYDIYIEPLPDPACNHGLPPTLKRQQQIDNDTKFAAGLLDLNTPGNVTGHIAHLTPADPSAWTITLLEATRGLPISAAGVLTKDLPIQGFAISANTSWDTGHPPILRLAPAITGSLPTIYWSLVDGLWTGSTANPVVEFTAQDLVTTPTVVTGRVTAQDGRPAGVATLLFQSTMLTGTNAQNAAFSLGPLQTDADGNFSVSLPMGSYQVRAIPRNANLAVTDRTFDVSTDPITVPLDPKTLLSGQLKTPTGEPLPHAQVSVAPPVTTSTYWLDVHTLNPDRRTRPAATNADRNGRFSFLVDPGATLVTVAPGEDSNFPWRVDPDIDTASAASPLSLRLSTPVVLSGHVRTAQGAPAARSEVTAWWLVGDVPNQTAVKVARATTGADGTFTVVLPSSM